MKRFIALLVIIIYSSCSFYSQTASQSKVIPESYTKEEFPNWAHQIRRTEIITLGSLPFTTLGVSTVYGLFRYITNSFNPEYIPNPLAKSSSAANLDEDEQKNIVIAAVSVSLIVGIVDLVITLLKNAKEKRNADQTELPDSIKVQKKIIQQETVE